MKYILCLLFVVPTLLSASEVGLGKVEAFKRSFKLNYKDCETTYVRKGSEWGVCQVEFYSNSPWQETLAKASYGFVNPNLSDDAFYFPTNTQHVNVSDGAQILFVPKTYGYQVAFYRYEAKGISKEMQLKLIEEGLAKMLRSISLLVYVSTP